MADGDPTTPTPTPTANDVAATTDSIRTQNAVLVDNSSAWLKSHDSITLSREEMARHDKAVIDANKHMGDMTQTTSVLSAVNEGFNNTLMKVGESLSKMNTLSDSQSKAFSFLSASIFGVKTQFETIGTNTEGLVTFKKTLSELQDTTQNSTALMGLLTKSMKVDPGTLVGKGFAELKNLAMNLANAADNATLAKAAMVQAASSAGNLGKLWDESGQGLMGLNDAVDKQIEVMNQADKATGIHGEQLNKYWAQLLKIPGAMDDVVKGTQGGDGSMNKLTSTILFAAGTGRDYSEVLNDISHVYKSFGTSQQSTLNIISRVSEITKQTGVDFMTVKGAIMSSADALKTFTGSGKDASLTVAGLSSIMSTYTAALKGTGLSADTSMGIIKGMVDQTIQLNTAQKSFLSQQSGGPGGLMGAAQIQKQLKDDPAAVFEKVKKLMTQQMGPLVNLDDASKSESAARQLEKQRAMLKNGPLGQLAKTDSEADAISAMLKDNKAITQVPTTKSPEIALLERGNDYQKQMVTSLDILASDSGAEQRSNAMNLGHSVQENMAASHIDSVRDSMATGQSRGAQMSQSKGSATHSLIVANQASNRSEIPDAIKQVKDGLGGTIKSTINEIGSLGSLMKPDPNKNAPSIVTQQSALQLERDRKMQDSTLSNASSIMNPQYKNSLQSVEEEANAGQRVGAAAGQAVQQNTARGQSSTTSSQTTNTPDTEDHTFHLNVTGYCIKCKQEIEGSAQRLALNPTSK